MPCADHYFPFFVIEAKSQARGGTIHHALSQVTNAGAVVGNGMAELTRRCNGRFNFDEPYLFALTLDHYSAHSTVHFRTPDGQFRMTELEIYLFRERARVRDLFSFLNRVFAWGKQRHSTICKYLDAYTGIRERQSRIKGETIIDGTRITPIPPTSTESKVSVTKRKRH